MDLTLVFGDNSWKFQDDTMRETLSKRCHRWTDGQTDKQTDRRTEISVLKAGWSQLKNGALILCYFKLCASFRTHWWIQTGVTVQKRPIWVKIDHFLSRVTFRLDEWPWKTIGHLFYNTLSFVHHFNAIGKLKLKLQSRNAQFGSKSTIFLAVWPWNFTDDLEKQ